MADDLPTSTESSARSSRGSTSSPRPEPVEGRRRVKYAATAIGLVTLCSYGSILPIFRDQLQRYLGIGDRQFGLMFSIGSITGIATVLVGGALVDRWGPRRVLRICLVGIGAAMSLLAVSGRRWVLMAAALGIGAVFSGPLFIALNAYLVQLFPGRRRRVLSLNLAAHSAGGIVFPSLAEGLLCLPRVVPALSFALVLHGPFALVAVIVVLASFLFRARGMRERPTGRAQRWRWRDILLSRRVVPILMLMALHAAADTTLYVWMPRFLGSASFPSQRVAPGFVLSGCAAAYVVSRGALALVPERRGRRAFLVLPGLLGGGALIAGILSRDYMLTAGGYVLGSFLWSVEYPTMLGIVAEEEPERFGQASALGGVISAVSCFLVMNLTAWLVARMGDARMWKAMLFPALGFICVGAGGALWVAFSGRLKAAK